jgi:succinoglycan biosynthesis protein ExoV
MIYEWKLDGETRNFGNALPEVLYPAAMLEELHASTENMYFLIGSVICNEIMDETLRSGYTPIFMNCGWRGEGLNDYLVAQCIFEGARGPHTQEELAKHDVDVEVTHDPAYELPSLYAKDAPNGLAIVVRHIKDKAEYSQNTIHELKADALFSPVIQDGQDILDFIQKISGARFVLSGSMHACMVAHAYGVPFAPLLSDYVDCPEKWFDWFAAEGLGNPIFVNDVVEGRKWHNSLSKK